MRPFAKVLLLVLSVLACVYPTKAYNSDDTFNFVAPKGYTEYRLAQKLSIKLDTLRKYNPQLKTRPFKTGMPLCLPASLVSEKELRKIDKAATLVKGGLNLRDNYAQSESNDQSVSSDIVSTDQNHNLTLDLENRYKQVKYLLKPYPNIYDKQYYITEGSFCAKELVQGLNLPIETVHQLAIGGIFAGLDFTKPFHNGFTQENFDAYRAAIDYLFAHPEESSKYIKVKFQNGEVNLTLFMPTIVENTDNAASQHLLSDIEYMRQNIWRASTNVEGFDVFVSKGQDWLQTAKFLKLTKEDLKIYNPDIDVSETAKEECIIVVPNKPSHNGGNYKWSQLNLTQQYEILDEYALNLTDGNLNKPMALKERLQNGRSLFHYDKISIEGELFWSINNINQEVTAKQISETIGMSLDQLKAYCQYAAALRDYEPEDKKNNFHELCQYYLSHPNTTIEELRYVSSKKYNGASYQISISIPQNPSDIRLNADGTIAYPAVVPEKVESKKTLRKFFSNSPKFKCPQTNTELVLSYEASDGFVAYVDGKRYGTFEIDVRDDRPSMALIGLPWLNGWGPAPLLLTLDGKNTNLALLPVQGEENLSYNSRGYFQYGRTGNTNWLQLSLSSEGISFTPVESKPDPEIFWYIGFNK